MSELAETGTLVARVFRCGRGHKNTIGVDYLDQVGPWPTACTMPLDDDGATCGDPWVRVDDVHQEVPGDD